VDDDEPEAKDLSLEESVVLAAAMRVMMAADGELTTEEWEVVGQLAVEMGFDPKAWEDVWTAATRTLGREDKVRAALEEIRAERTREIVYEVLYRLANADGIDDREWDLLEWLDETWEGFR